MDRPPRPRDQPSSPGSKNPDPSQIISGPLQTSLRYLPGIGPKRAEQLAGIGLLTVEDLLYHLPFRYEDRRRIKKIGAATAGQEESFVGRLVALQKRYNPRRRAQIMVGRLADDSGVIGLLWYRAPAFLANRLAVGQNLLVHGKIESGAGGERRITHPEFEVLEAEDPVDLAKIVPVYLRPAGVSLTLMRKGANQAVAGYA